MISVSNGVKSGRRAVKIEKPRPLKLSHNDASLDAIVADMEAVAQSVAGGGYDTRLIYPAITGLCENLKLYGPQLEAHYKDQLDKCYGWLRTACRDDRLSLSARYRLLEIIELRAMNWKPSHSVVQYYQNKLHHIEAEEASLEDPPELYVPSTIPAAALQPNTTTAAYAAAAQQQAAAAIAAATQQLQYGNYSAAMLAAQLYSPQYAAAAAPTAAPLITMDQYSQLAPQVVATTPLLSPGEVVRPSGKFSKPTRIAGKNYCKDEVVIRNQDSGKVMGIKGRRVHMIEELSETIISFQRVAPGARERMVQITGPTDENIAQARQLIEDTIRRNASPVRDYTSSGGGSVFSSSSLNGSSSSIATDDDNTSIGKRASHDCDTTMADYRYTVTHDHSAIRITGANLGMVRTAKLVLDEFFNGERNMQNIVDAVDRSTPPLLVKPATPPATPPLSSSPTLAPETPRGEDSPKNAAGVGVVRQPLFPSSSKAAVSAAEQQQGLEGSSSSAVSRRAAFLRTSEERAQGRGYNRSELLLLAEADLSRTQPPNWAKVQKNYPELVRKGSAANVLSATTDKPALISAASQNGAAEENEETAVSAAQS